MNIGDGVIMKLKAYKIAIATIVSISTIGLNTNIILAKNTILNTHAEYAIAIDKNTKQVLYNENGYSKMYPASTTKIWTAYLVAKNISDLDTEITVDKDLSYIEPTSMYLEEGETFTIRDLLKSLLLNSSNDVAVLLAEYVSGSVENFSKLMNSEAKKIGCINTNFTNPNGLPDENHYSTAYDMVLMGAEAIKNKDLQEIFRLKYVEFEPNKYYENKRIYVNSNKFITGKGTVEYNEKHISPKINIVKGGKTGYTNAAGRCLVSMTDTDGIDLVTGVFNSQGDYIYSDTMTIMDYVYNKYKSTDIIECSSFEYKIKKAFTDKGYIEGYIKEDYNRIEEKEAKEKEYIYTPIIDENIKFPIQKNDKIGIVEIYENGKKIDEINMYSKEDVYTYLNILNKNKYWILGCIGIFSSIIIKIKINRKNKYDKIKQIKKKIKIK